MIKIGNLQFGSVIKLDAKLLFLFWMHVDVDRVLTNGLEIK